MASSGLASVTTCQSPVGRGKIKLAFTTLGCPGWSIETIISRAVEYGFHGVDFRGYKDAMEIHKLPEFDTCAEETARRFADANLEVPCFSSSAYILEKPDEYNMDEVTRYARLCRIFGARFIRAFAGRLKKWQGSRDSAVATLSRSLDEMGAVAAASDATVILETHDDWCQGAHLRAVMEKVTSPSVGILWDTHNTYEKGEAPSATWDEVGPWVRYTHWKDSSDALDANGHRKLCLFGRGDCPLGEMLRVLKRGGYDGYLTLEWEKHWRPAIEEPESAFPQYVQVMKRLLSQG